MSAAIWGAIVLAYVVGGVMGLLLAGLLHSALRDDRP